MKIEQNSIDALNAEIVINLQPSDYNERFEKALKDYRKNAQIPGFRPGHVPVSLVKKRFGKALLAEEINRVLQSAIFDYIEEKKLNVLGNPLPKEAGEIGNWDEPGDFQFIYEVGLAPDFKITLDKSQSFDYHRIIVDEKLVDRQLKDYARRYGTLSTPDLSESEDMLTSDFQQLDASGAPLEGGVQSSSSLMIENVHDEATRKQLIGLKVGDVVTVNPHMLNENHEDLAKMLGITHHDLHRLDGNFSVTVKEVRRMLPHALDQELFDKIFEAGTITSEEAFRARIKEDLEKMLTNDSDWMFKRDFAASIVDRVEVTLPDDFLKRWILMTNEKPVTEEALAIEYPSYAKGLRWQLIENKLITDNDLKVSSDDAINHVKGLLIDRFAQYGIPLEDDRLTEMAKETLSKREEAKNVYDTLYETKIMEVVMANCTINEKVLSYDEFVNRIQHSHAH